MINLSVQALEFIFSQVVPSASKVIWLRDPSYARQIYVSSSYEKIWGRPCEELYNAPSTWNDSLADKDKNLTIEKLKLRSPNSPLFLNTVYFRINDIKGKINWIKDTCFHLNDSAGQQVAVAGVGEAISQKQWEKEAYSCNHADDNRLEKYLLKDLSQVFQKEFGLVSDSSVKMLPVSRADGNATRNALISKQPSLTIRQKECLFYLIEGKSSKQIAKELAISPRTVEAYIDEVKRRLNCRTRIELLGKLASFSHQLSIS